MKLVKQLRLLEVTPTNDHYLLSLEQIEPLGMDAGYLRLNKGHPLFDSLTVNNFDHPVLEFFFEPCGMITDHPPRRLQSNHELYRYGVRAITCNPGSSSEKTHYWLIAASSPYPAHPHDCTSFLSIPLTEREFKHYKHLPPSALLRFRLETTADSPMLVM